METAGEDLLSAVAEGDQEEVCAILQAAPKQQRDSLVAFRDGDRWNSLHVAANNGDCEVVELLLQEITSPACLLARSRQSDTPLHLACGMGHSEVVRMLLKPAVVNAGGILATENKRGETPLHCAAHAGADDVITMLISTSEKQLQAHAENGGTPLHYASAEGNADSVLRLLELRADPKAVDYRGRTFEDIAHPDVRKILSTVKDDNVAKNCNVTEESIHDKVLELGNGRLDANDHLGAKRAFSLLLKLCSGSSDFDEIFMKGEIVDEESEPLDLDDPGNRMQPGRGGLDVPKSCEEQTMEAYSMFRAKQQSSLQNFAQKSLVCLGRCHFRLREFRACISSCTAALVLMPECAEAFHHRGLAYLELEEYEHAERDLSHSSSLAPNDIVMKRCATQALPKLKQGRSREIAVARRMLEISNEVSCDDMKRIASSSKANVSFDTSGSAPISWEVMD